MPCSTCNGLGEVPVYGWDEVGYLDEGGPGCRFYGIVGSEPCEACLPEPQAETAA
ncbi:MAG TPA: hypothetical protein VEA41_14245 [Salinarimonas sp.]|nr:hypothetical protein [Salinarimonas sp.]